MQFFSSDKPLQEIFFQNHPLPPPPPSRVKWSAPNEAQVILCVIWSKMEFQLTSQICCHMSYPWDLLDNRTGDKFNAWSDIVKVGFSSNPPNIIYPLKFHQGDMNSLQEIEAVCRS